MNIQNTGMKQELSTVLLLPYLKSLIIGGGEERVIAFCVLERLNGAVVTHQGLDHGFGLRVVLPDLNIAIGGSRDQIGGPLDVLIAQTFDIALVTALHVIELHDFVVLRGQEVPGIKALLTELHDLTVR